MKARPGGNAYLTNSQTGDKFRMSKVVLCEEEIPGVSLNGKDISKLTVLELRNMATSVAPVQASLLCTMT